MKMYLLTTLILLLLFNFINTKTDSVLKFYKFEGFCLEKDSAGIFRDVRLRTINKQTYVSAKLIIKRDINEDFDIQVIPQRCSARGSLDSCEMTKAYSFNNMCRLLDMKNMPWSSFMAMFEPTLRCPFKKGVYKVINASVEANEFIKFSLGNYYWMIELNLIGTQTKDLLMCIREESKIVNIK